MKILLEQNDQQFLEQLHRLGSATIREICSAVGVTATAVRQRLAKLQKADLVARETVRAGRGRPHHVYRVTEVGTRNLGDDYAELAQILWNELQNVEEPAIRQRIVEGVRQALIKRLGEVVREGSSLRQRVRQLQEALTEQGFDVEMDESGSLPVLRENNCPYQELASTDRGICDLEQEVFEEVLGTQVRLTECFRAGDNCCAFQAGGLAGLPE